MKLPDKIIIRIKPLVTSMVYLSFLVSFLSFILYSQDINYSDKVLFLMLIVMRYSSFILCVCSLYKLSVNIYHFFRRPSIPRFFKSVIYLIFLIYGAFIVFYESFITVIAGGNE